jgi:hypothetical protein
VFVDSDGKLGTMTIDANGNKMAIPLLNGSTPAAAVPQRGEQQAVGPDPNQALLNRKVEEQEATIAELKSRPRSNRSKCRFLRLS